ncbi:uncharacterized protein LOC114285207 [Camellia sinensis]|uniref:uncharacterized protein LOC114285207 n=1 Tax=Camellia sinensis TaxID=4442 RepID=UPI001035FFB5|nr:uncharacterized protein LOC114285207 [Camellia sinensis]
MTAMNKLLMEENDRLQKQVSQLVCENGFMRQQLHTDSSAAKMAQSKLGENVKKLQERSRIMLRFADLLEKHSDHIAVVETWDNGKPYEQAANEEIPLVW